MTTKEAMQLICEKIGEVYNNDFPCICGDNPLATNLNSQDVEKLNAILAAIDLLKE